MKVGDYIRTKNGWVCKLDYYDEEEKRWITHDENDWYPVYESQVKKSSSNINDLIEVDDYVNGFRVKADENGELFYHRTVGYEMIKYCEIKSIVTKERFEAMEYKVGE